MIEATSLNYLCFLNQSLRIYCELIKLKMNNTGTDLQHQSTEHIKVQCVRVSHKFILVLLLKQS